MKKITSLLMVLFCTALTVQAQSDAVAIQDLLQRHATIGNETGAITDFFTADEIQMLNQHYTQNANQIQSSPRLVGTTAYAVDNVAGNYGNFDIADATTFNVTSTASGTANFEGAGAIDPNDQATAYVLTNANEFYSLDIATGNYTDIGPMGAPNGGETWVGLSFDPISGNLYGLATDSAVTTLYLLDPVALTATPIGPTGMVLGIALAIDGSGTGYSYDLVDDQSYSIDLLTGAATVLGPLGFDANFGQGMTWDDTSDTVYLASFNNGVLDSEWRSLDTTSGATTLVSVINSSAQSQHGWASIPADPVLGVDDNVLSQVAVYPNPASDVLNIKVPAGVEITSAVLYDVLGKNTGLSLSNGAFNTASLARGVYLLTIETTAGTLTEKVVKR